MIADIAMDQSCLYVMSGNLDRAENISAAVRRILINETGKLSNLDQVAKNLHISKSTLKRRLESESTNFRIICDEVRSLLAKQYLAETELSVEDVAHLMGYTEMTNFRRAFVRWNNMTPSKFSAAN